MFVGSVVCEIDNCRRRERSKDDVREFLVKVGREEIFVILRVKEKCWWGWII